MMEKTSPGKEIRSDFPQPPRGTAAENESPPFFIAVIEMLHCIENGRNRLGFIHKDIPGLFPFGNRLAESNEFARIRKIPGPFTGV
ncbi:MAG: hypothetical protein RDV48_11185 [Candidatus Eremiobacteraeota bacterium]|nr:hypothetical protein [Candidatus Eremiobacteraeota bacterium]